MAEQSLSSRFSGTAAQLMATKGRRGARARRVNQSRQQLLAGAAFGFQQNVGTAARRLRACSRAASTRANFR